MLFVPFYHVKHYFSYDPFGFVCNDIRMKYCMQQCRLISKFKIHYCCFVLRYASLLLLITASMSGKLKDVPFNSRKIKRRPLVNLSTGADDHLYSIFSLLEPSNTEEILQLFHSSFFIIPTMLPLWTLALEYFEQQR